jgi:hypothetical protein
MPTPTSKSLEKNTPAPTIFTKEVPKQWVVFKKQKNQKITNRFSNG